MVLFFLFGLDIFIFLVASSLLTYEDGSDMWAITMTEFEFAVDTCFSVCAAVARPSGSDVGPSSEPDRDYGVIEEDSRNGKWSDVEFIFLFG